MSNRNQIESFKIILEELGERQWEVLETLEGSFDPMTNRELARHLNREVHQVSPRVRELIDKGLVREAGTKVCSVTRREVTLYGPTSVQEREDFVPKTKASNIRMEMGVSLNPRTQMWVVYFKGEIVTNVERFHEAEAILKRLYLDEVGGLS